MNQNRLDLRLKLVTIECHYNVVHYIGHITVVTGAEYECKFEPTKDIPYHTVTSKLWGTFWEDLGENWLCYNGTTLYIGIPYYVTDKD